MKNDGNEFIPGERVLLAIGTRTFLITLLEGHQFHTNKGFLDHDDIIGMTSGTRLYTTLGTEVFAFRPGIEDLAMKVRRHTNIVYPKDLGLILTKLSIGPGMHVLECGTGSGALTLALAWFVGEDGGVTTVERRPEFVENARENVRATGLLDRVSFLLGDLTDVRLPEHAFDACVLDLPEPWTVLDPVWRTLAPGAPLCAYVPTVNQVEHVTMALASHGGFARLETVEVLVRPYKVARGATRPDFRMVAHTGFLTFARTLAMVR